MAQLLRRTGGEACGAAAGGGILVRGVAAGRLGRNRGWIVWAELQVLARVFEDERGSGLRITLERVRAEAKRFDKR